jgi:hypothetical protein
MDSSGLFSHPHQPEAVHQSETASDPVQMPAFSDQDSPRSESQHS